MGAIIVKLTIEHLPKQNRRDFWGIRELDIEVGPGVIDLLGPNGAGKSTLMRMLTTVTQPSEGTIQWNGVDIVRSPDPLRASLSYLPQDFGIYPHLRALEFLEYLAAIKGMDGRSTRCRIDGIRPPEATGRPLADIALIFVSSPHWKS